MSKIFSALILCAVSAGCQPAKPGPVSKTAHALGCGVKCATPEAQPKAETTKAAVDRLVQRTERIQQSINRLVTQQTQANQRRATAR